MAGHVAWASVGLTGGRRSAEGEATNATALPLMGWWWRDANNSSVPRMVEGIGASPLLHVPPSPSPLASGTEKVCYYEYIPLNPVFTGASSLFGQWGGAGIDGSAPGLPGEAGSYSSIRPGGCEELFHDEKTCWPGAVAW